MALTFRRLAPFMDRVPYRNRERLRALLPGGGTLVDVGGGTGRVAGHLRDRYARIVIADLEPAMLARARAKGFACVVADARRLPFRSGAADAVLAVDAFHHFPEQPRVLAEAGRVGKRIVIEEFDPTSFGGALVRAFEGLLRFGSVFHRPERLARLAREATGRAARVERFSRKDYAVVVE